MSRSELGFGVTCRSLYRLGWIWQWSTRRPSSSWGLP